MFSRRILGILGIMMIIIVICPMSLRAMPGDCNGDAHVNVNDAVFLVNYFFDDGMSPGNRADCDCDGHPGITFGDILQLLNISVMGGTAYPSPGMDLSVPSQVKFYFNSRIDFGASPARTSVEIDVDVPAGFDIDAFCVPFSFAADPGGQVLDVADIDFAGTVAADIGASLIDNTCKSFVLLGGSSGSVIALPGGTHGKLCTVNFNLVSLPSDNPIGLKMSTTSKLSPLLFHQIAYSGTDLQRVYLPELMRAPYGDVNSDQNCNVSDAIYIINYIFMGGPYPGALEPWQ